jgi:GDPmannose 4,6-dehydratase
VLIEIDARYFRPTKVDILVGDPSKARKRPRWRHKTSFDAMVKEIVAADLAAVPWETERRPPMTEAKNLFELAGKRVDLGVADARTGLGSN